MQALDEDTIVDLQRAAMQAEEEQKPEARTLGQCHLFAVKPTWREGIVLVGNRHFLIEWPLELVDTTAPSYRKILKAATLVPKLAERLTRDRWDNIEDLSLRDKTKLFECEEIEPPAGEKVFAYEISSGQRFYFNRFYRAVFDKIWPMVEIKDELYPSADLRISVSATNPARGYLVIYQNGRRQGILASTIIE